MHPRPRRRGVRGRRARWRRHFVIDYGTPRARVRADRPGQREVWRRIEAAATEVLRRQRAVEVDAQCDAATFYPSLTRLEPFERVSVPAGRAAAVRPAATSAAAANDALRFAYRSIRYGRPAPLVFSDADAAAMRGESFADPHVRVHMAWTGTEQTFEAAALVVIWSPESRHVYVIDRSQRYPAHGAGAFDEGRFDRETERVTLEALRALRVDHVRVSANQLCKFPTLTGRRGGGGDVERGQRAAPR